MANGTNMTLAPPLGPAAGGMPQRRDAAWWRRWLARIAIGGPIAAFAIWAIADNERLFFITLLNGLTLGSLYFIVASGFTLVFGLMRNVNLAHGSLYLLGGYIGFFVAERTGSWLLAVAAGFACRSGRRPRDATPHLPAHAGRGSAADDGHDRSCRSSSPIC